MIAGGVGNNRTILDALERHRDFHFRRIASRRVTGEKGALKFIGEVGFCTGFTAGMGVPCLREAIAGRREPVMPEHIQHDYAIGMTWRIKDALPQRRAVYYGKVLARRPSFIARDMLGAFLKLRAEPGSYRKLYQRGGLSHCAKLVMDALSERGAAETRVLKLSSGCALPSRRALFDRAMAELQEKFLALKVDERADPFSYVWDTMEPSMGRRDCRGAHAHADAGGVRDRRQILPDRGIRQRARDRANPGNRSGDGRSCGAPTRARRRDRARRQNRRASRSRQYALPVRPVARRLNDSAQLRWRMKANILLFLSF